MAGAREPANYNQCLPFARPRPLARSHPRPRPRPRPLQPLVLVLVLALVLIYFWSSTTPSVPLLTQTFVQPCIS